MTITAYDGTYTTSQTFSWEVDGLSLSAPADQSNMEGSPVSLTLAATDYVGSPSYTATGLPSGLSLNSSTGVISGTLAIGDFTLSPYQVNVTATDGSSSSSQSFVWSVTPAIALASPGPQYSAGGDAISLDLTATDRAGGTLTFSASGLPLGLGIDSTTGVISGTIDTADVSATPYVVTLTAADGTYSSSQTISWTVSDINLPAPADQTNLDDDVVSLSLAGTYNGGGTLTYSAPGLPAGLSINASTGLVTGTIADTADLNSPYSVTVTATDGTNSVSQSFNWEVDPRVTVDSIDDQTNVPGDVVTLQVSAASAGPGSPAPTLTYSATGLPAGLSIDSALGVITGTITAAVSGTPAAVTVTADDGTSSVSQTFNWTVAPVILNDPGDQANVGGSTVSLNLSADLATGYTAVYGASGLPNGLGIDSGTGAITGTLDSGDTGNVYLVTLSAAAGGVTSSQDIVWRVGTVVVTAPADQTSTEGDAISVPVSAQALSGTLSFSAVGLPDGLSIDSTTGVISGTMAAGAAADGPFSPTIMATNGTASDSQTFNWNVNPKVEVTQIDDPPSNVEGDVVTPLQVTATESGATLAFSASGLPLGLSIDSTGLITGTIATGDAADSPYSVDVTVTDGTYSSDVSFSWNITNGSTTLPTLANPGTQVNAVGDSVNLPLSASDSDGDSLTFSADALPSGLSIDQQTGIVSGTMGEDAVGTTAYTVTVTGDNGNGASASQTFNWIVNESPMTVLPFNLTATQGTDTGTVTLASFTNDDPNSTADMFSATIDWGDGTVDTGMVDGANGNFTVSDDHVYTQAGIFTVAIAITDGSQTVSANASATVSAAPAILVQPATLTAVEGTDTGPVTVASFTSADLNSTADDFSTTIDWGDGISGMGTVQGANGSYDVIADHVYDQPGNYAVQVSVSDGVQTVTGAGSASVTPAALSVTGGLMQGALAGSAVSGAWATFTDGNADDDASSFVATIDWGDGSSPTTGTVTGFGGDFVVSGSYPYAAKGTYTVTVTVTDADGAQASATSTAQVGDLYAGLPSNLTVASFTSSNPNATASQFTATVDWGDETPLDTNVTIMGANGSFTVQGAHTYNVDSLDQVGGVYTVVVTVTGPQGELIRTTVGVSVVRPPATGFGDLIPGLPGVPLSNVEVATFTEPDVADPPTEFSATINWGDGTSNTNGMVTGSDGLFHVVGSHTYTAYQDSPIQVTVSQAWSIPIPALVIGARFVAADGPAATVQLAVFKPSIQITPDPTFDPTLGVQPAQPYSLTQNIMQWKEKGNFPIAYSIGKTAAVDLNFTTNNLKAFQDAGNNLLIHGMVGGVEFFAATKPTLTETGFSVANMQASKPFGEVTYDPSFTTIWEYSLNGPKGPWETAGKTVVQLFVTYKQPTEKYQTNVYLSALWQGCSAGAGLTAKAQQADLIAQIWSGGKSGSSFAKLTVKTITGDPLTYYQNWTVNGLGTSGRELLAAHDGTCDAWAAYFMRVLGIQGITSSYDLLNVEGMNGRTTGLLINNWVIKQGLKQTLPNYYNLIDPAPIPKANPNQFDASGIKMKKVDAKWQYMFVNPQVTYKDGKGQNYTNPFASFLGGHRVVQIGNDLYDPSYGQIYSADGGSVNNAMRNFLTKSVFGIFQLIPVPMAGLMNSDGGIAVPAADAGKQAMLIAPLASPANMNSGKIVLDLFAGFPKLTLKAKVIYGATKK